MRGVEIVPVRELSDRWRRRLLAVVAGLALVLTAAAPGAPASAAGPGSVAGIVTDAEGTPLEGIEVAVLDNTDAVDPVVATDLTDEAGAYRVDGLVADPYYRVRFLDPTGTYATEYHRDSIFPHGGAWVAVVADEVTTLPPASLELGSSLSGRLTRAGGDPVSGGVVQLFWQQSAGSWSGIDDFVADADGRWTIPALRDGTYSLRFWDPVTHAAEVWDDQPDFNFMPVGLAGADLTGLDAELGGDVTNLTPPTISGTPQVGEVLTAAAGTWAPSGTTVAFRWVVGADTSPGDDPTGATYTPTAQDVGKTIRVQAVGSYEAGWRPATVWSAATASVAPAPVQVAPQPVPAPPTVVIVNERRPRIKGTLRVDRTVRVTTGDWTPYPRNLTFAWYAGGTKVKGAIHRRLRLTEKLVGKRLVVRVTATAPGYEPLTVRTRRSDRVRR